MSTQCPLVGNYTAAAAAAIMNAATVFDNAGVGLSVGLFTNQIVPTWQTALADLNEAAFPGYARVTALKTWKCLGSGGGVVRLVADAALWFTSTGPTSPAITVYGAMLIKPGTPDELVAAYADPNPINFAEAVTAYQAFFDLYVPLGIFESNGA